jgi:hypothetical protein
MMAFQSRAAVFLEKKHGETFTIAVKSCMLQKVPNMLFACVYCGVVCLGDTCETDPYL